MIGIEFTTFSLIGRCERTGMLGIAIATSEMAVGSRCIHVAPGVGAVVTQASTNPRLGHLGLNLMRAGYSAPRALGEIAATDQFVERRQLGCLDVTGLTAARRAPRTSRGRAIAPDRNVVVAANAGSSARRSPTRCSDVFQRGADLALWERLLRALEAGKAAGGQPTAKSPAASTSSTASRTRWSICGSICIRSPSPGFAGSPTRTSRWFPTTTCAPADPNVPSARRWLARSGAATAEAVAARLKTKGISLKRLYREKGALMLVVDAQIHIWRNKQADECEPSSGDRTSRPPTS